MRATIDKAGRVVIPKQLRDHVGLPPPVRRTPQAVARLFAAHFSDSGFLRAGAAAALMARLQGLGIAGGVVHDALVGETAREHDLTLATRDRRALQTYRALDVRVEEPRR